MNRYSYGSTPKKAVIAAVKKIGGYYDMELNGSDYKAFAAAVNEGIDSHLEAITDFKMKPSGNKMKVEIGSESMAVLLRRLLDQEDENAEGLRSAILETLGIEEI